MALQPEQRKDQPLLSLARADEAVGVVALLAIVGSILWGVVSRYVFPQPAAWTYEVAVIAFAYLVFFGAVAGVRLGTHAAIDGLVAMLPAPLRSAVAWFNYLLLAAFFTAMAVLFGWQAWIARGVHTIALDLSRGLIYAPLAVASLGMLAQHLAVMRPWAPKTLQHADSLI